jgi:hypothetical protein
MAAAWPAPQLTAAVQHPPAQVKVLLTLLRSMPQDPLQYQQQQLVAVLFRSCR